MKNALHEKSRSGRTGPSPDQRPLPFVLRLGRWAPTLVALALLFGVGCSTTSPTVDRGVAATVVVVPAGTPELLNYVTPLTKEDALENGLRGGFSAATSPGGVFFLPLTLSIGAAQGLRGKTAEQIDDAERTLANAATALQFHRRVCEALVELGPGMTGHQWVLRQAPPVSPKRKSPTESGGDAPLMLLVELPFFGLDPFVETEGVSVNPTLRFRARVLCRATNLTTGEREEIFKFSGGLHKFLTWAEDAAARFRDQANRGVSVLAERIIRTLFAVREGGEGLVKYE